MYRALKPDTSTLTGTVTATTTSKTVTGTGTVFDQQILEGDVINIAGQEVQVDKILSPTTLTLVNAIGSNVTNGNITVTGTSDVWDDRFLKKYATALLKQQWGTNLKKFGNIMMPGGVTLNGKEIWDEATLEIKEVEEDIFQFNSLPSEIVTG